MEPLRPIVLSSIHEEVQKRIKEYILTNELRPGDFIPSEPLLAKQLGVSRTVVREGLRSLESLGVIGSRRGAGRYVNSFNLDPIIDNLSYSMLFDTEDMQEIIAVRERLEAGFIAEAIEAMGEATLNQLRDWINKMRQKAAAGQDFLEEDLAFHDAIYQVTGNRLLVKLLDVFEAVYHNLRDQSLFTPQLPEELDAKLQDHVAILQAIEAKDTELAQRRMIAHFDGIKERLGAARLRNEGRGQKG